MENEVVIKVTIANYEEIINKLETIKKLLNDIANIDVQIEVKN